MKTLHKIQTGKTIERGAQCQAGVSLGTDAFTTSLVSIPLFATHPQWTRA
jgi:hypothetical protein